VIARKEQIRDLLRAARARIDPARVGLRRSGKPRSPGLRREDVAVLAGVSVKWYTWLEQGREVNFSDDVVARVSAALNLTPAERGYLTALLQQREPKTAPEERLTETLWRTVRFVPVPALVMTRRWDIVAWNDLTTRIYRDYATVPRDQRNLLRIILTDEKYQSDPVGFDAMARKLLSEFRVDFSQFGDAAFEKLIVELKACVPDFERRWRNVEICNSMRGTSIVQHDVLGELAFDRVSYVPEGHPFMRVLMFTPRDLNTARIVAALCAEATAESSELPAPDIAAVRSVLDADVVRHINRH
jgi:transcriptional regulator with XRE-family HTH domain